MPSTTIPIFAQDAYDSGYDHGCDDAKISDSSEYYINQPEKGPSFHTSEFMKGYNDGIDSCSIENIGEQNDQNLNTEDNKEVEMQVDNKPSNSNGKDVDTHSGRNNEVEMQVDNKPPTGNGMEMVVSNPLGSKDVKSFLDSNNKTIQSNTIAIPSVGNFSTYLNSTYGIKILYPSDWKVMENHDVNNTDKGFGLIVSFISNPESVNDKFNEIVYLSLDNIQSMDLKDYVSKIINNSQQDSLTFKLNEFNTNSYYLSGHPAYKIDASDKTNGLDIKSVEIGTKIDEKAYSFTYFVEGLKYFKYLPLMQTMIDSFQINATGKNISSLS